MLRKNVASQVLTFNMVNATTGAALTGATVTTKVTLDGTQSAGGGTVTELGTGQYKYVPTQAETNGSSVGCSFTATNAVPVNLHCFTIGQDPALTTLDTNPIKWNGTAVTAPNTAGTPVVDVGRINNVATTPVTTVKAVQGLATDGVVPTVTTVTNQLTAAAIATGIWQDATAGDFTAANSVGKSVMNGVALGTGLTINAYTGNTAQTGDSFARLAAPAGASVSADIAAINAKTTNLPAAPASTTNITAGTVTTATNVTTVNGLAAAVITAASIAADAITAAKIADGAIDRATFAADTGLQTVRSNTAQTGAAGTITLDAGASAVDSFYNDCRIYLTGGTGTGQSRLVSAYVGATKVASVTPNWTTTPDVSSTFVVVGQSREDLGLWTGTAVGAVSATAIPAYLAEGSIVEASFADNAISSRVLDATAGAEIGAATWDLTRAGHATAGTFGQGVASVVGATASVTAGVSVANGGIASTSFAAGAIDAAAIAADAIGASEIAADAIGSSELAASAATEIADALLTRDMSAVTGEAARSPLNALRRIRNRVAVAAGTATVYKEDDSTSAWTAAVTTTAGNPVSEVDPA